MKLPLKMPDRDSLGWLIPILLFGIFYGIFLWVNETGFLGQLGILFFIVGTVGLSFSRRIRRLVAFYVRPRTSERRDAFVAQVAMDQERRRAKKEGVPELITGLYFDYIQNFPDWFASDKESDEKIVPQTVTGAKKMSGNRIAVEINGTEYIFTHVQYVYTTEEGEREIESTLQISAPDKKLLLLHLGQHAAGGNLRPLPVSLEYIYNSGWVNDFKQLRELIDEEKRRRSHEDRMD